MARVCCNCAGSCKCGYILRREAGSTASNLYISVVIKMMYEQNKSGCQTGFLLCLNQGVKFRIIVVFIVVLILFEGFIKVLSFCVIVTMGKFC